MITVLQKHPIAWFSLFFAGFIVSLAIPPSALGFVLVVSFAYWMASD